MSKKPIIGVMGPGHPTNPELLEFAEKLGRSVAENNWILLTGGRPAGVMEAASKGAALAGGLTLGILPGNQPETASEYVHIPIVTGMGHARNMINILTSHVVVICGMGAGTLSEASLAIKTGKPLITTHLEQRDSNFLSRLSGNRIPNPENIESLVQHIQKKLKNSD